MKPSALAASRDRPLRLLSNASPFESVGDEALLEAFARAEPGASAELYDRLIGVVEGTLYRMLGEKTPDHDDLVQSVFEQIVLTLRRKSFARGCRLTSWAGAIASNLALNAIRRRQSERARNADGSDLVAQHQQSYHDLHEEVSARQDLERVRIFLSEMKEERAMPVILCDILGHSVPEVADLLGASQAAVQSRLTRGRRELRQRFEESPIGDEGGRS